MSSFRIDRQYVTFVTAEAQPVRSAGRQEAQRPAQEAPERRHEDLSKLYEEIYERLRREHAEQAENMLSKAAEEAREIVEKARLEAEEIIGRAREVSRQAEAEAERIREKARREAQEEAQARRERDAQSLAELESSLREKYEALVGGLQGEVISLVMEIARKVIGIKLSESDEVFMGLVREAIERLRRPGAVVIRVSPEDYARHFGSKPGEARLDFGETKASAVVEPGFSAGDIVVESEGEMVDLSVNRQLDMIENAFAK